MRKIEAFQNPRASMQMSRLPPFQSTPTGFWSLMLVFKRLC